MSARLKKTVILLAVGIASLFANATVAISRQQSSIFEPSPLQPVIESSNEDSKAIESRLRITWGGSTAKRWQGQIRFVAATIYNPTPLGYGLDSASAINVEDDQIMVTQSSPSTFDGLDVDVKGGVDSKIIVELYATDEKPIVQEFSLVDAMVDAQICALDQDDNRFSVTRVPGDDVQFRTDRQALIFEPGETFAFSIRPNPSVSDVSIDVCNLQIKSTRNNVSTSQQIRLNVQQLSEFYPVSIQVPEQEGVYELALTLGQQAGSSLLGAKKRSMTREVQFVVIDPNRPPIEPATYESIVAEVEPTQLRPSNAQRDSFSRFIGIRHVSQTIGKYDIASDGSSVELPSAGWQAIPLSVKHPNRPHVIEIDYPGDQPMSLGVSVLQPDESGQIPNFGFDSGFHIPDSIIGYKSSRATTTTHRFSFWPNEKDFVLLLANRSQSQHARYHKIRVREAGATEQNGNAATRVPSSNRKFLVYYEQPLISENFAVRKQADVVLGQPLTDWNTFYESANRLVQYLKDSGAGGAFISVFGEGSSLMPLSSTLTTPRYDSGVFSSTGRDPIRKDVVELFYRIFDREGLTLVPVLSFDQPLEKIEFHHDAEVRKACRLIEARQSTEEVAAEPYANLPIYNPLCEEVQNQVTEIVREISKRYSNRQGFVGLAVACRPDTYTMLPGSRYGGYDRATVDNFAASLPKTKTVSFNGNTEQLFAQHQTAWLQWRTEQMTHWYQRLAKQVAVENDRAKLFLPLVDIFRNEEAASSLSPSLYRATDVADVMNKLGFSNQLNESGRIELMQPTRVAPIHPLAINKRESHVQNSGLFDEWFGRNQSSASSLFSHRSSWARFENLESSQMLPQQTSPILRLQQLHPGTIWNRERFARSLLRADSRLMVDGGLLLNTNLDHELKAFLDIYHELPDKPFEELAHQDDADDFHPIAVRYVEHNGFVYLYCVNGSPWEITANVHCQKPTGESWQALGDAQKVPADAGADGKLKLKLAPFDLVGLKIRAESLPAEHFDYLLPVEAQRELSTAFYRMRSKLAAAGNTPPIHVLHDPDFENAELQRGWSFANDHSDEFSVSTQSPWQGGSCLQIDNEQDSSVWIRSNKFEPPMTGRLSVAVWLKLSPEQQQPPLRISIESTDPDSTYYRFAEVGSLVKDRKHNQIATEWKRFAVHFDDLPQDKLAGLRVGFDMMGPGSVSVDKIELYDRWFDESDQKSLTQMFASVGSLLQQPEKLERCRQLLSGYWPSFLREYVTEEPQTDTAVHSGILNEQPAALPANRSSMRRRFRRFVSPKIFQFR